MGEYSMTDIVLQKRMLENEIQSLNKEILLEKENVPKRMAGILKLLSNLLESANKTISEHATSVVNSSSFDAKFIGNHIADLMSRYEGIPFVFQDTTYKNTQRENCINDWFNVKVKEHLLTVINKEYYSDEYEEFPYTDIKKIEAEGNAIILYRNKEKNNGKINFYYFDSISENPGEKEQIKINGFTYVLDFVDDLISYRLDNSSELISEEVIEEIKGKIIETSPKKLTKKNDSKQP